MGTIFCLSVLDYAQRHYTCTEFSIAPAGRLIPNDITLNYLKLVSPRRNVVLETVSVSCPVGLIQLTKPETMVCLTGHGSCGC